MPSTMEVSTWKMIIPTVTAISVGKTLSARPIRRAFNRKLPAAGKAGEEEQAPDIISRLLLLFKNVPDPFLARSSFVLSHFGLCFGYPLHSQAQSEQVCPLAADSTLVFADLKCEFDDLKKAAAGFQLVIRYSKMMSFVESIGHRRNSPQPEGVFPQLEDKFPQVEG